MSEESVQQPKPKPATRARTFATEEERLQHEAEVKRKKNESSRRYYQAHREAILAKKKQRTVAKKAATAETDKPIVDL